MAVEMFDFDGDPDSGATVTAGRGFTPTGFMVYPSGKWKPSREYVSFTLNGVEVGRNEAMELGKWYRLSTYDGRILEDRAKVSRMHAEYHRRRRHG